MTGPRPDPTLPELLASFKDHSRQRMPRRFDLVSAIKETLDDFANDYMNDPSAGMMDLASGGIIGMAAAKPAQALGRAVSKAVRKTGGKRVAKQVAALMDAPAIEAPAITTAGRAGKPVIPEEGLYKLATPDVEQKVLPFQKIRATEPPDELAGILGNVRKKYTPLVEESIKSNPKQLMWYLTSPFAERWRAAGGDPDFILQMMGPTSSGTNVAKNIETSFLMNYLEKNGLLSREALRQGTLDIPKGYANRRQPSINKGILRFLEEGGQDPTTQHKIARFVDNLRGNWAPGTVDLQVGKVIGEPGQMLNAQKKLVDATGFPASPAGSAMRSTSPQASHYPWIEKAMREEAERVGIPTAAYQAAGWPGQDSRPFLQILNELINEGAQARGLSPNKFFDLLAKGRAVLGPGAALIR